LSHDWVTEENALVSRLIPARKSALLQMPSPRLNLSQFISAIRA